jgi:hypothetical protein
MIVLDGAAPGGWSQVAAARAHAGEGRQGDRGGLGRTRSSPASRSWSSTPRRRPAIIRGAHARRCAVRRRRRRAPDRPSAHRRACGSALTSPRTRSRRKRVLAKVLQGGADKDLLAQLKQGFAQAVSPRPAGPIQPNLCAAATQRRRSRKSRQRRAF